MQLAQEYLMAAICTLRNAAADKMAIAGSNTRVGLDGGQIQTRLDEGRSERNTNLCETLYLFFCS